MYSRGGNAYGQQQQQQPYASQSSYGGQNLGHPYTSNSVGEHDGSSQLQSSSSRHLPLLGGPLESDGGYRGHSSSGAHYGGQYGGLYGSSSLSSTHQVSSLSAKVSGPSGIQGRGAYGSAMPDSPKFNPDYIPPSTHGYAHKSEKMFSDKISDYSSMDRHHYSEQQPVYAGRDLHNESSSRYGNSSTFGQQRQVLSQQQLDMLDRADKATLLRQEQLLKVQSLQSIPYEGTSRQADYLAARGSNTHNPVEFLPYSGRVDTDVRNMSMLNSSFSVQQASSILGAAPRRNADDLVYVPTPLTPGYGVSLPPGRDYASSKGLRGSSLDLDFPSRKLSRDVHSRIDDHKDDTIAYARELDRREDERRRERLREREKEREQEEHERKRERERDRERENERKRERERDRVVERREKERDRERERARVRTPTRTSKERHGVPLRKDVKLPRRDSPHREALHRLHSPVKEKAREYSCKIFPFRLVDVERDYLSLDKRYPRLFISPECSKVYVNWPKETLTLPLHIPVSFEHGFVDEAVVVPKGLPIKLLADEDGKPEGRSIVWNAKMILMSGLSKNSLDELSSERIYNDRVPHFCNMLRFVVLKRDHLMYTMGGPWDPVDGGDPSVDDSALVRTILRYARDQSQLDLSNCQHWNRFLEIHYDRVGSDGLFSHKEITVLFVPDLSNCLPSIEVWRDQWLAFRKFTSERKLIITPKKEKPTEKNDRQKVKEKDPLNEVKKGGESATPKQLVDAGKQKVSDKLKECSTNKKGDNNEKKVEKEVAEEALMKNNLEKAAEVESSVIVKPGKKKIIKRVVKQKVLDKDGGGSTAKQVTAEDEKDAEEKSANSNIALQQDDTSAKSGAVKTFVRKKVVKKTPGGKSAEILQSHAPIEPSKLSEDDVKSDTGPTVTLEDAPVKTIKRKIVRRVVKRKVSKGEVMEKVVVTKDESKEAIIEGKNETVASGDRMIVEKKDKDVDTKKSHELLTPAVQERSNEKLADRKSASVPKSGNEIEKQNASNKGHHVDKKEKPKEKEKAKDEMKREKDGKEKSKGKLIKEVSEKKRLEEPPHHPGFVIQTKGSKDSKLRSLSLSLDSLLDYTDKDIEESAFELSLFAETFNEMLQYQMGSRILSFLQQIRIKFLRKRYQRKRQREESSKESEQKSSEKRPKTNESKPAKVDADGANHLDEKTVTKDTTTIDNAMGNNSEEDPEEYYDDPEEDPEEDLEEEDEEMQENNDENNLSIKEDAEVLKKDEYSVVKPEPVDNLKDDAGSSKEILDIKPIVHSSNKEKESLVDVKPEKVDNKKDEHEEVSPEEKKSMQSEIERQDSKKKMPSASVDKELLKAFRYFDRNRAGYIRVEDLRLIIHNLGNFLSHRDVKELVQSALLESNTGRDDRILYNKLLASNWF